MGITAGITFAVTALLLLWMADAEARGKPAGGGKPDTATEQPVGRVHFGFAGNGAEYPDNRLYLYGGDGLKEGSSNFLVDFWSLNLNQDPPAWTKIAPRTTPGSKVSFGFACSEKICLLVGGSPGGDETWVYSQGNANWTKLNCRRDLCPSTRVYPTLVYDASHQNFVLFGGQSGRINLGDTYLFDPDAMTWTLAEPGSDAMPGRYLAGAVAVDGGVLMYGGVNWRVSGNHLDDMHFWDGSAWSLVTQSGNSPGPLYGQGMVYDGSRVIMAGGSAYDDGTANQEAWSFSNGTWSTFALTCDRTPVRNASQMAYDQVSNTLVFFGGLKVNKNGGITGTYADLTICPVN